MDQALDLLDYREGMPTFSAKIGSRQHIRRRGRLCKTPVDRTDRPVIDVEISSCNAYPNYTYNVQGTRGGLQGSLTEMKWRYFKEEEAPEQHLIKTPLMKEDGSPAYCSETDMV